jgi:hypothetical protein
MGQKPSDAYMGTDKKALLVTDKDLNTIISDGPFTYI